MNAVGFSRALGEISDRYLIEAITYRRDSRRGWLRWGALAAGLGLVLTAALAGVWGGADPAGLPPEPGPVAAVGDGSAGGASSQSRERTVLRWDDVAVNESPGAAPDAARLYYDPARYETENWGGEEVTAFYGWDLTPGYLPNLTGGDAGGFVCRERASGEIVEDHGGRGFWADTWEDGSPKSDDEIVIPRGFTVAASRTGILYCALLPVDGARTTSFGGTPVTLSHASLPYGPFDPERMDPSGLYHLPAGYYDIYTASFTLDGVEYEITAQRLALEELVRITASVVGGLSGEEIQVQGPSF